MQNEKQIIQLIKTWIDDHHITHPEDLSWGRNMDDMPTLLGQLCPLVGWAQMTSEDLECLDQDRPITLADVQLQRLSNKLLWSCPKMHHPNPSAQRYLHRKACRLVLQKIKQEHPDLTERVQLIFEQGDQSFPEGLAGEWCPIWVDTTALPHKLDVKVPTREMGFPKTKTFVCIWNPNLSVDVIVYNWKKDFVIHTAEARAYYVDDAEVLALDIIKRELLDD